MTRKHFVAVATAALIATGLFVTVADAGKARQNSYRAANDGIPSLDDRVLGYPRTCWSDTYRYDGSGATVGPYCH